MIKTDNTLLKNVIEPNNLKSTQRHLFENFAIVIIASGQKDASRSLLNDIPKAARKTT